MAANTQPLVLAFLARPAAKRRADGEVMDAWRTSCPRLTVREAALDSG